MVAPRRRLCRSRDQWHWRGSAASRTITPCGRVRGSPSCRQALAHVGWRTCRRRLGCAARVRRVVNGHVIDGPRAEGLHCRRRGGSMRDADGARGPTRRRWSSDPDPGRRDPSDRSAAAGRSDRLVRRRARRLCGGHDQPGTTTPRGEHQPGPGLHRTARYRGLEHDLPGVPGLLGQGRPTVGHRVLFEGLARGPALLHHGHVRGRRRRGPLRAPLRTRPTSWASPMGPPGSRSS